jgi:methyltransferase-like protein 27
MADDAGWLVAGLGEPEEVRRRYDEWAGRYDDDLAAWRYDAPARAAQLATEHLGGAATAAAVLDAGCGTGLVGRALRANGVGGRLVGIDISPASLAVAGQHAVAGRPVYDALSTGDLQQPLPFADDAFDAAVCVGVLTYVPDTPAVWRELARVVRAGGVVVCTQRDDVWRERRCDRILDGLERDGTLTATHLSRPREYLPGNADFGDEIGVRYLVARVR